MHDMSSRSDDKIVKTVCSLCYSCCGVLAHVKNGKVVNIEGDPDHPSNRGELCIKGSSGIELLYHKDRLNYPLKRVGDRGEGKWQRITWDEALDSIANKLGRIKSDDGPEAICISRGGGLYGNAGIIGYFGYLLGTPNVMSFGFMCHHPHVAAVLATIGYPEAIQTTPVVWDETLNSKCILLWAANPRATAPYPVGEGIFRVKEEGAKLIVVDPRPTDYAQIADIWLQIRPSTDDALALGMIHVIINEDLYDRQFVAEWTYGFDELKKHVQDYSPRKVSSITWVPENTIREAARMFAKTKPSCVCQRVPLDQNCNSVQTSRAILILNLICGNLDKKGGNLLPAVNKVMSDNKIFAFQNKLPLKVLEKRIGAKEFPLLSGPDSISKTIQPALWAEAVLRGKPYPIKAHIISGRNWMLADQNSEMIERAFKKIEFTVTMDLFMTPTAMLSDIVLPAASWLERDGLRGNPNYPYLTGIQHRAVGPLYERWDDLQFFIELAKKMKLEILWSSVGAFLDFRLKDADLSFNKLQGKNFVTTPKIYERYGRDDFEFKTSTEKIELYSHFLEKLGYDPLPQYVPPPEITPDFPLILIGGMKRVEYVHSTGRQIEMLRQKDPDPLIEMSPNTAKEKGISEGDWVWIETIYFGKKKRVKFRAKLIEGFHPRIVAAYHGWWFPERPEAAYEYLKSNVNLIIPADVYDPIYGSPNIKSIPCRIQRA